MSERRQLDELWSALLEGDAETPPAGLGARIVDAALDQRPAGRPALQVPAISPVEGFRRQVDAFDALLGSLGDADWHRPALRDLDVQGLVGHLVGVELDCQRALDSCAADAEESAADWPDGSDHIASTAPHAIAQSGRRVEETHADWRATAHTTLERLQAPSLDSELTLHGMTLPLGAMLVVRTFELWTHDEDIRRATGRPLAAPGPSTLQLMTQLANELLPAGVSRSGVPGDGGTARIVLTGAGGGCWTAELPPSPAAPLRVRIVTDAVDFCRLVAGRIAPADLDAVVSGDADLAARALRGAAALALD